MTGIDTPSLWDVEDAATVVPKVRDMIVAPVTVADVAAFCRRYHYSLSEGAAHHRWGLWHEATLLGVIAYNNPPQRPAAMLFGTAHTHNIWHMSRLAVSDKSPRNSESRLISGSLAAIVRSRPEVWAVITYADTSRGHVGYVYQATNALYTGLGGYPAYFLDQAGVRKSPYRMHNGVNTTLNARQAAELGWTTHRGGEKHRYVYILGNKRQRRERMTLLRLPILPYPKADEQCKGERA